MEEYRPRTWIAADYVALPIIVFATIAVGRLLVFVADHPSLLVPLGIMVLFVGLFWLCQKVL